MLKATQLAFTLTSHLGVLRHFFLSSKLSKACYFPIPVEFLSQAQPPRLSGPAQVGDLEAKPLTLLCRALEALANAGWLGCPDVRPEFCNSPGMPASHCALWSGLRSRDMLTPLVAPSGGAPDNGSSYTPTPSLPLKCGLRRAALTAALRSTFGE